MCLYETPVPTYLTVCRVVHNDYVMPDPPHVGAMIRRARKHLRMTQQELANRVGVSRTTVDAWENGRSYPKRYDVALEEVLGISLDGTPEPGPEDEWERWERAVLANPDIPAETARAIVSDANAARDAHFAAVRTASASREVPSSPAVPAARTAARHRAAG
jgi:transcriptional regulator with XRE-family HTH domain